MKPRYIIGAIILVAFFVWAFISFDDSKIEYMKIDEARQTDKTVQVVGSWVKDKPYSYDSEQNKFTFHMVDEKNNETLVVLDGMKPNNFEIAPTVVVKGQFKDGVLHADNVLTKCPSKYEGDFEDHEKATNKAGYN